MKHIRSKRTALYRHFDAAGTLLYVGISLSVPSRLAQHRTGSAWSEQITRVDVQWFGSRSEAEDAERRAIRSEGPLFNVAQSLNPWRQPAVARQSDAERHVRGLFETHAETAHATRVLYARTMQEWGDHLCVLDRGHRFWLRLTVSEFVAVASAALADEFGELEHLAEYGKITWESARARCDDAWREVAEWGHKRRDMMERWPDGWAAAVQGGQHEAK